MIKAFFQCGSVRIAAEFETSEQASSFTSLTENQIKKCIRTGTKYKCWRFSEMRQKQILAQRNFVRNSGTVGTKEINEQHVFKSVEEAAEQTGCTVDEIKMALETGQAVGHKSWCFDEIGD